MPREGGASSTPRRRSVHTIGAAAYWIARSSRAMTVLRQVRRPNSLRLAKLAHVQQHELIVVGLVGIAARRERQVVVIADDDTSLVEAVHVRGGDAREG